MLQKAAAQIPEYPLTPGRYLYIKSAVDLLEHLITSIFLVNFLQSIQQEPEATEPYILMVVGTPTSAGIGSSVQYGRRVPQLLYLGHLFSICDPTGL